MWLGLHFQCTRKRLSSDHVTTRSADSISSMLISFGRCKPACLPCCIVDAYAARRPVLCIKMPM
jgi:hypothetical protein